MLVIFAPIASGRSYVEEKLGAISKCTGSNTREVRWNQGARVAAFHYGLNPSVDLVSDDNGWFLGYAYWDSLPKGYDKDSKTLLEISHDLWKQEGVGFLKRLNGSFNVFLYDAESGNCLFSTDRFGTHPLWMAELDHGGIAFSPDYNLLRPLVSGTVDSAGIWSSIGRWRPVGDHTLLKQIKGIRQATAVFFDKHSDLNMHEWCPQIFKPEPKQSLNDWAEEFNRCLRKSTEQHLNKAATVGILLSGGIDSRILASYCPKDSHCFTLADFENRELKTASKISQICRHHHIPIIRDADWYPRTLVPATEQCAGLWRWSDAHFMLLKDYPGSWQEVDCVVTGNWFDTFFKGAATPIELWSGAPSFDDEDNVISFCLKVEDLQRKFMSQMKEVMPSGVFEDCHQAHRNALTCELKKTIPNAFSIVDAWDMTQFGSVYRSSAFPNIHCLRDFKPVRNLLFENSIYDMYFRVPAIVRQRGEIVRRALWQCHKRLGLLIDSNSWLPSVLPGVFHQTALKLRFRVALARNAINRKIGRGDHRSHGAWTKISPLWSHNDIMKKEMNTILKNPGSVIEQYFDMDKLRQIWKQHQQGVVDYYEILSAVVGLRSYDI